MRRQLSFSAIVPTYKRRDWLQRAVRSLELQVPTPTEIIVVVRDSDRDSHEVVARLQAGGGRPSIRKGVVTEPGFMPPVKEGIRLATGDIVAVMDDDAEAQEGWVRVLQRHYADPSVGAVGGRCINMNGDSEVDEGVADRVGYVSVLGRFVGNMYKRPSFVGPRDVEFLMGGCMSYRREVAQALEFDSGLNRDVASSYEVDLGLQVRAKGLRVVFDPEAAIRHYSAPREVAGLRAPDLSESVYWSAYNETRVVLRRLSLGRATVGFAWRTVVGYRRAPGIVPWILGPLARAVGFRTNVAGAALRGIGASVRDVLSVRNRGAQG